MKEIDSAHKRKLGISAIVCLVLALLFYIGWVLYGDTVSATAVVVVEGFLFVAFIVNTILFLILPVKKHPPPPP